jgi:small conductance mechanosensitive channel
MLQSFNEAFNKLLSKLSSWLDLFITGLPNAILAILVMVTAIWMSNNIKQKLLSLMQRFSSDKSVNSLVASSGSVLVVLISLFIALNIMNLDQALTSLLTTAGIAGLAVGMALQDPLMNTFSGIMMSMRKFYNIGDWIRTNGYEGQIRKINLRWTELQKPSGERIVLPNKVIVSNPLENYSIAGRRRVELDCGVAYDSDLNRVQRIAKQAVLDRFSYLDNLDQVEFFYTSFADSSINFVIRFWMQTKSLVEYKAAKSQALMAIKEAFDTNEINIPFPIRTIDLSMVGDQMPQITKHTQTLAQRKAPENKQRQPGKAKLEFQEDQVN